MTRKEFWQLAYLAVLNNPALGSALDRCDFAESVANLATVDLDNFEGDKDE